jgi:hypothetical protein
MNRSARATNYGVCKLFLAITKYTVIHGVCKMFLANKLPNIRSYTVNLRCFWQRNHQIYGVHAKFWPTLRVSRLAGIVYLARCK